MALDLKQNYFFLFGLEVGFKVPLKQLAEAHLKLQAVLHPDRHTTANAVEKRVVAQKAAFVNEAHRVLSDDCARAIYLLELAGMTAHAQTQTTQDIESVTEQIELREQLECARGTKELESIQQYAQEKLTQYQQAFALAYQKEDFDLAQQMLARMQLFNKLQSEVNNKITGRSQ